MNRTLRRFGAWFENTTGALVVLVTLLSLAVLGIMLVLQDVASSELTPPWFLSLHLFLEVLMMMFAFSIFAFRWLASKFTGDAQSLYLAAAFLSIGFLHVFHLMTYEGMSTEGASQSTRLYFRLVMTLSTAIILLGASFTPRGQEITDRRRYVMLIAALTYTAVLVLVGALFSGMMPAFATAAGGLTPLMLGSESLIVGMYTLGAWKYWRLWRQTKNPLFPGIHVALLFGIAQELTFMFVWQPYSWHSVGSHLFGFASFFALFVSLFQYTVTKPFEELSEARTKIIAQNERLERNFRQLRRSSKNISTYFDFLAHDVTNLMTPIMSYAEMVASDPKAPDADVKYAERIIDNSLQISSLILGLRRLSEAEMISPTAAPSADLVKAATQAVEEIRHGYPGKNIHITVENTCTAEPIVVGGEFVQYVIAGVLDNCVKNANGSDSEIELVIRSNGSVDHPMLQVDIADHGKGVSDDLKPSLTAPFWTSQGMRRGVVSNLGFLNSILRHFGGSLELKDRVKGDHTKGSLVIVTVPGSRPGTNGRNGESF